MGFGNFKTVQEVADKFNLAWPKKGARLELILSLLF